MRTGREQMLNEIPLIPAYLCFPGRHPDDASSATSLRAKFAFRRPLDVAAVGDGDDASFIGDQILESDVSLFGKDRGEPFGSILVLNSQQLFLDDRHDSICPTQNVEQINNLPDNITVFVDDFFAFESGQLVEAQIENLIRL